MRPCETPLSVEYLYFYAQRKMGRSAYEGAVPESVLEALESDGQPEDDIWPYNPNVPDPWEPPDYDYETFKRGGSKEPGDIGEIVQALEQGRPVVMLLTLSRCFYSVDATGLIDDVVGDPPDPAIRHAVVAYAVGETDRGQLVVGVRNSWGEAWGLHGTAWLTESFISPRLFGFIIIDEV